MNLHQNRWIDVGYRTVEDNERVIIECKSGLGPCKDAAKTFFAKSIALARSDANFNWASFFLCLTDKAIDCHVPGDLHNLKMKTVVLEKKCFLASTTLCMARASDSEDVQGLKDSIASETKVGAGSYYEGGSQIASPNHKRPNLG